MKDDEMEKSVIEKLTLLLGAKTFEIENLTKSIDLLLKECERLQNIVSNYESSKMSLN